MSTIAGIDLGTTYSALAALDELGKPRIRFNSEGDAMTPSVVFLEEDGILVGKEALNSWRIDPARAVRQIKHHMGETGFSLQLDGKTWTSQEISALILKKLAQDCSGPDGEIRDVVITVPASFEEPHRAATEHAGEIAGLRVRALVNEPTAAALYYATAQQVNGTVLVYDLGGGTFDATVMRVQGTNIEILSSDGNRRLGGVDFDAALLCLVAQRYKEAAGVSLIEGPVDEARALSLVEGMKRTLSRRPRASEMFGRLNPIPINVTRDEFESLISSKIATTEMLVDSALDQAKLRPADIDRVLLVGGSTRIPMVSQRLERRFGKPPLTDVNVDQAVALGAAIQTGLVLNAEDPILVPVAAQRALEKVSVSDVAPASFGTIVVSQDDVTGQLTEKNVVILHKNTPLHVSKTDDFYTMHDGQAAVEIQVTQGDDEDPEYVRVLDKQSFELPPNRPQGQQLLFTYRYDKSGRIQVHALDVASGLTKDFDVASGTEGVLSQEERVEMTAGLEGFFIE